MMLPTITFAGDDSEVHVDITADVDADHNSDNVSSDGRQNCFGGYCCCFQKLLAKGTRRRRHLHSLSIHNS